MVSKARLGTFLGSVIFLFSLSTATCALAQSTGDETSALPQQTAPTPEAKTAAPADAGTATQTKSFTLEGGKVWVDTGISLEPGQRIAVTSEGTLRYTDAKADNGPDGLTRGFKDLIRILPYNGAGRGAVIGRIGDVDIAQPFVIGAKKEIVAPVSGKFALGINQSEVDAGTGSYTVKVEVYPADSSAPREIAKEVLSIPGVDNSLFVKIPRRIGDKDGNAGDMVNFLILGDEDQMKKVFTSAGWVKVDAGVSETVLAGFIASHLVNHRGEGMILDVLLGIVGAVLGGWIFHMLGMAGVNRLDLHSLIVAAAGSAGRRLSCRVAASSAPLAPARYVTTAAPGTAPGAPRRCPAAGSRSSPAS